MWILCAWCQLEPLRQSQIAILLPVYRRDCQLIASWHLKCRLKYLMKSLDYAQSFQGHQCAHECTDSSLRTDWERIENGLLSVECLVDFGLLGRGVRDVLLSGFISVSRFWVVKWDYFFSLMSWAWALRLFSIDNSWYLLPLWECVAQRDPNLDCSRVA